MNKELATRLEALKKEQDAMNQRYDNNIANIQAEIKKAEEEEKQAINNQNVTIPMSIFCEIINTLESGMASDELVKKLTELGKDQISKVQAFNFIAEDNNGIPNHNIDFASNDEMKEYEAKKKQEAKKKLDKDNQNLGYLNEAEQELLMKLLNSGIRLFPFSTILK